MNRSENESRNPRERVDMELTYAELEKVVGGWIIPGPCDSNAKTGVAPQQPIVSLQGL